MGGEEEGSAFVRERYRENARFFAREPALLSLIGFGRLRRMVAGGTRGRTLEVAIGSGLNLPFYPKGVDLTGVDLSPEMLAYARERASQLGMSVDLREADAGALPFPDASFDTVTETFAGCTFPDPVAAYREMRRVLRPGGRLLVAEHGRGDRQAVGHILDRLAPGFFRGTACNLNRDPIALLRAAGWQPQVLRRGVWGVLLALQAQR